jgi:hypothetical protein
MNDGRIFKGTIVVVPDYYYISMKEGTLKVAQADVQSIEEATN